MRHFSVQACISFKYAPIPLGQGSFGELGQILQIGLPSRRPMQGLRISKHNFSSLVNSVELVFLIISGALD